MNPTIEPTGDPGLALSDPIEGVQFGLLTDRPVSPSPADPGRIPFPVDRAVVVETDELVVPKLVHVAIRRPDGAYLSEYAPDGSEMVESGDRLLDVSTAPMVLYVRAPGPMTFRSDEDAVRISFQDRSRLVVGCRSFHEHPATTVTVPPEPTAAMEAVSTFGSALKTTTCERSYPTLRGHPPRVEFGGELSIPDGLEPPSADVHVEVPPTLEHVFPVAPLAYYLGAEVRPGEYPALHANGFEHPLDGPDGFEVAVHRALQRVFFLDCVVRTEGLYQVPLDERSEVRTLLPADVSLSDLYDASLAEQLEAYLSLPTETVRDLSPEWSLCVDVAPEPTNLEALPYLVDDLALVRCIGTDEDRSSSTSEREVAAGTRAGYEAAVEEFVRSEGGDAGSLSTAGDGVSTSGEGMAETFRLPSAPAMEHAYLGPGCPLGVNKCSVSALRRRLDQSPADDSDVSVRIVCNDDAMASEDVVEEYYGLRELVQFDVTVDYALTKRDLRGVLASDVDFLHYVGHIDDEGIACADGRFDARTLDEVGVDAFLLNACDSYRQGRALVEAGAQGGVVTTATVSNTVATAMGRTLARAFNSGFTLRSALSIADDHHPTAYRYLVLGDGGLQLVQGESGIPYSLSVESLHEAADEDFRVDFYTYPDSRLGPGPVFTCHLDEADGSLPYGHVDTFHVSKSTLAEFLHLEIVPVSFDGQFLWSDEFSGGDVL